MKRLIALLASVTAVFVVAAGPVAADPGAPASSPTTLLANSAGGSTVPKDALGLSPAQVAGSGLAVTLDAGASEEHDLVVSNHTANLRLTVKLDATDATGNVGADSASWLSFGDDAVQLDPHVAATVPMTVAVPHDTQPGSVLAHVSATVESAVSAADGSPVSGTATVVIPVSIVVSGTPSAQIAIADVHRVDQGSNHQLAVVLRNFGAQGAQVSGHVRVAGDSPQTLPFQTDLAASRDTTLDLDWKAPPVGTAADIAVDLEYGDGNVASWSSRLGVAATDLSPTSATVASPATVSASVALSSAASTGTTPSKPVWKQPFATVLAVLMVLAAGAWFALEMRSSRRRREWSPQPAGVRPLPAPTVASVESIELAQQLVRLTDVVVQLVESHRLDLDVAAERERARSPDARAGPEPPGVAMAYATPLDEPRTEVTTEPTIVRSPPPTPGASSRPEPVAPIEHGDPSDPVDPRVAMMERLTQLDRERRRLRDWMDNEDSGATIEPPVDTPDSTPQRAPGS